VESGKRKRKKKLPSSREKSEDGKTMTGACGQGALRKYPRGSEEVKSEYVDGT